MSEASATVAKRAIALMVVSMAAFALGDASIKAASRDLPPGQILAMMGLLGACAFAANSLRQGHQAISADLRHPAVLLRTGSEMVAASCFVTALSLVPLALASAIFQSVPIFVVIGAALVLGERVGPWRWGAVLVGLIGMGMILNPGLEGFDANTLWAVAAVFAMSIRDLSTRYLPSSATTYQLATWAFGGIGLVGLFLMAVLGGAVWPTLAGWVLVVSATLFTAIGFATITISLRMGEVSAVAPYRYMRIVFTLILAIVLFGERPDFMTLSGATILVAAGLVMWWRETRASTH